MKNKELEIAMSNLIIDLQTSIRKLERLLSEYRATREG